MQGGEAAALARLKYYLWDSDLLATYFDTRNGMLGGDYSTKFAPWLALGCLSPRKVRQVWLEPILICCTCNRCMVLWVIEARDWVLGFWC